MMDFLFLKTKTHIDKEYITRIMEDKGPNNQEKINSK